MQEEDRTRLIEARWQSDSTTGSQYAATINNRSGLLADISRALTEKDIDIISMNTRTSKQGLATMETSFRVSSREQLRIIVDKIRQIDSVIDIERTTG